MEIILFPKNKQEEGVISMEDWVTIKNIKEEILKEFRKEFSDLTHVSCLDKSLPCGTVQDDVAKFISKSIDQAIASRDEEWREKIETYQNGFVKDDGFGNAQCAPEWQVIEDLINSMK